MLVKTFLFIFQLLYSEGLEDLGEFFLQGFENDPKFELVFVMLVMPIILNGL